MGVKFRRQHAIGPYVVDFVCMAHRLIVEVDGGQHALRHEQDTARTRYLEDRGFTVVRFWNHDVLRDTDAVVAAIRDHLMCRT